ncbi:MAG: phosphatidate cytidylyltransferase [Candidatus Nomurabacteria bacterium]|nr:phosphatidate cytidylyltransferase [Candidatus Nomurabacteria bacterium]
MRGRVKAGIGIALFSITIFVLGFLYSPQVVAISALALGFCIYCEIASWQEVDRPKQPNPKQEQPNPSPEQPKPEQISSKQAEPSQPNYKQPKPITRQGVWQALFGLFAMSLFLFGSIALYLLALRSLGLAVAVFAVAYTTDMAAMGLGRLASKNPIIGKTDPPLLKWAPSKTLAGFIGGYLGGLIMASVMFRLLPELLPQIFGVPNSPSVAGVPAQPSLFNLIGLFGLAGPPQPMPLFAIFLAPIIAIFADLLGSRFKRINGIKDSGQILAEERLTETPQCIRGPRGSVLKEYTIYGGKTLWTRTLGRLWRGILPHGGFLDRFGTVVVLALFVLTSTR